MIHPELAWSELISKEIKSDLFGVEWEKMIESTEKISKFLLRQKDFDYCYFMAMLEIVLSKISLDFPEPVAMFMITSLLKKYSSMNPSIPDFISYRQEMNPDMMVMFNEILEVNRDDCDISEEKPAKE